MSARFKEDETHLKCHACEIQSHLFPERSSSVLAMISSEVFCFVQPLGLVRTECWPQRRA